MPNINKEHISSKFPEFTLNANNQILELQPNIKYLFGRNPKDSKQYPPGYPNISYINLLPNGHQNFNLDRTIISVVRNSTGILISKFKTPNLVSFSQHNPYKNPENFIFSDFQQVVKPNMLNQIFIIANDTSVTTLTHTLNQQKSIFTVNFSPEKS